MVKDLIIALLCCIMTTYVSADVLDFNIYQEIDHRQFDSEFMVVSLINQEDYNSQILDSYMDGAEAYYQKKVQNKEWAKRSLVWLRGLVLTDTEHGGI